MSRNFFVMLVTDPAVDVTKSLVGLACAAQAVEEGHCVRVFFAGRAVLLLQTPRLAVIEQAAGVDEGVFHDYLTTLVEGAAGIHCSSGSQALLGFTPEEPGELREDLGLIWDGPEGVVSLAAGADVQLVF